MGHLASMQTLGKVHLIWQGGDEDIEDGLQKFLDTWKGGSENIVGRGGGLRKICILQNQEGGATKKLNSYSS